MQNEPDSNGLASSKQTLVEGLDFYLENGLLVLTAHFLLNRGYCCGNKCRNCPYEQNMNNSD